ncbi:MAG: hupR, partial [Mucilaginibacter sp.]|nr:hupR [Mucilaginibacter sp.]
MSADKITILYVDDEEHNLFSFKATFRIKYQVLTAISGDKALEILATKPVHIIITDQRMPEMTGVEF